MYVPRPQNSRLPNTASRDPSRCKTGPAKYVCRGAGPQE